jgi:hypothetical protein
LRRVQVRFARHSSGLIRRRRFAPFADTPERGDEDAADATLSSANRDVGQAGHDAGLADRDPDRVRPGIPREHDICGADVRGRDERQREHRRQPQHANPQRQWFNNGTAALWSG